MKLTNIRMSSIFLVIIFLSFFITGCNPQIVIKEGKDSAIQDFYVDNYKVRVRITRLSDESEYLFSFSLFDKRDMNRLDGIKSYLDIKKYGPFHRRYGRKKSNYLIGLEPIYNKATTEYECKYKFTSKGKYELTIRLNEIAGKALEKDILVSFDQKSE